MEAISSRVQAMTRNAEIIVNGLELVYVVMTEAGATADETMAAVEKYHAWVVNGIDTYKGMVN